MKQDAESRADSSHEARRRMISLLMMAIGVFGVWLIFTAEHGPGHASPPAVSGLRTVRLLVEPTCFTDGFCESTSVTYTNEWGGTEQTHIGDDVDNAHFGPHKFDLNFTSAPGTFVSLSAQNEGDEGTVRVEIDVDGHFFKEAKSDEAYGIASVDGLVP